MAMAGVGEIRTLPLRASFSDEKRKIYAGGRNFSFKC
jgi:hypothetical protein